jgi:4-hydroxy-L-threonine phosphate dehydrogenase PdxA
MGDPGGIGPEISLKAALDKRVLAICEPVVVGSRAALEAHASASRLSLKSVQILETRARAFQIGDIDAEHGRAALDAARTAIQGALDGSYEAVVAAPHSETAIHAAGIEFDGYPSFVARTAGLAPEEGILMLCFPHAGREVRIAHVTLHAGVRHALAMISTQRVLATIRSVDRTLKRMAFEKPRIAVGGINPHAGEGGLFGDDEARSVVPAIEAARAEGIVADGPIGADTLLQRAAYDAYVVMLHDHGHIPAKLLAPNGAAALTVGTPVLFSSVAHGAAFDIAGQNRADPAAMVEAITRLAGRRRRGLPTAKSD